jgi:hypothetical protein
MNPMAEAFGASAARASSSTGPLMRLASHHDSGKRAAVSPARRYGA